jgi:pectate lyase
MGGTTAEAGTGGAQAGAGSGGSAGSVSVPPGELEHAPVGWASVSGDGVNTTTGGKAGQTVRAANAQALMDYAESAEPLVIELEGTYSVPRLQVNSNKTLIGVGEGATIEGGVRIRGSDEEPVTNVIVQNVRIHGASSDVDGDGMHIYFAHHVWIDHCEIWDSPDGNLDIVHASNWVTVSWTYFHYTDAAPDADHRFCNLIGHSDNNADEDTGRLKVTFHHNHWGAGVVERMPRVRFGQVHVFNNYYDAAGNNYCIGGGLEARLVVENNYFDGVSNPHIFYEGEPTAQIVADGNVYMNTTGMQDEGQGSAFDPPYDYDLDPAENVKAVVMANSGPLP